MKDPKKLTPKQVERKRLKKLRYEHQMKKNALTWKKRGRYARRRARFGGV